MAKIKNQDIFEGDLFKPAIEQAELLLKVIGELQGEIKTLAKTTKSISSQQQATGKTRTKQIKEINEAERLSLKLKKEKDKLEKQEIKVTQQLAQVKSGELDKTIKLRLELANSRKERKQIVREASGLVSVYEKESRKLNDLRKKYKNLALAEGRSAKSTRALRVEIQKLDGKLKQVDADVGQFQRSVGDYKQAITGSLGTLGQFATGAGAIAGGVMLAGKALRSAVDVIKNFQQANANLASVLGKSRSEIGALTEDAKRLGAATAFSASEVSQLQTEFAKLGFNEGQILAATEATLDLAAATGSELGEAAAIAGATLGGFGLSADQTGRIADVMAKSFSSSALDLEKFKESMKAAAPAAQSVGVSVEKTTALLGTLSNAGISGSKAGNALKNTFINLNKEGLTMEEGFEQVSKSSNKLQTAVDLVGKEAAAAFLVMADGNDETNKLTEAFNNAGGAAKKMADEQLDTLDGKLKILNSSWEGLILSMEDGNGVISDVSEAVVEDLAEGLAILSGQSKEAKDNFSVLGFILNNIKMGFLNLWNVLKLLTIPWQILFKLVRKVAESFGIMGDKVDDVAKIKFGFLIRILNSLPEIVGVVVEEIVEAFGRVADVIFNIGKGVIAIFEGEFANAVRAGEAIAKAVNDGLDDIGKDIPAKIKAILSDDQKLLPEIEEEGENAGETYAEGFIEGAKKKIKDDGVELFDISDDVAEKIHQDPVVIDVEVDSDIKDFVDAANKQLDNFYDKIESDKRLEDALKNAAKKFGEFIDGLARRNRELYDERIQDIDNEVAANKQRQDDLRLLAKQGQVDAKENLAQLQREEAELRKQREREEQKQARKELGFTALKTYSANAEKNPDTALQDTIKDISLLMTFVQSLQGFYEGTDRVGDSMNPALNTGKDDYIVRVDKDEKIFKPEHSKRIGYGMTNEEVVQVVERFKRGELTGNSIDAIIGGNWQDNQQIIGKFDELKNAIESQPVSEFNYDEVERAVVTIQKDRNKIIRTHKKQGGIW